MCYTYLQDSEWICRSVLVHKLEYNINCQPANDDNINAILCFPLPWKQQHNQLNCMQRCHSIQQTQFKILFSSTLRLKNANTFKVACIDTQTQDIQFSPLWWRGDPHPSHTLHLTTVVFCYFWPLQQPGTTGLKHLWWATDHSMTSHIRPVKNCSFSESYSLILLCAPLWQFFTAYFVLKISVYYYYYYCYCANRTQQGHESQATRLKSDTHWTAPRPAHDGNWISFRLSWLSTMSAKSCLTATVASRMRTCPEKQLTKLSTIELVISNTQQHNTNTADHTQQHSPPTYTLLTFACMCTHTHIHTHKHTHTNTHTPNMWRKLLGMIGYNSIGKNSAKQCKPTFDQVAAKLSGAMFSRHNK